MINKTGAQLFSQQNFQYLTGKTIQQEEDAEVEVIFPDHADHKKSIKSEHNIQQEQNEKLDKDLKPSSTAGSSLNSSMSGSGSIGLDDSEGEYEKIKEFFQNCIFLSMLQVFGPFMTTYLVYKYEILKNMPLKMKIKTFMYITSKALVISLSVWIMGASILFSDIPTKDYNYYKIEFLFNCVTGVLVTLAGSFLGRNALFNNQFFSQIYYLSEDKIKKQKKKEQKAKQSNASAAMAQKSSTNEKTTFTEESVNPQEDCSPQIFTVLQRERKIQQRMAKIMKRLFIDSQTFTLQMLSSKQLDNKMKNDISGKEGLPRRVPAVEMINKRDIKRLKSIKQTNQEKQKGLTQTSKKEYTINFNSPAMVQLKQLREFPLGKNDFTSENDHGENWLKPVKPDELNSIQGESQRTKQEEDYFDDQHFLEENEENVQLNGRKLCNELLLQCEKVESLKHKRFKRFIFCTFLFFKGVLPCFFRMKDGLNFFGSNILVGMTCQLNRQIVYGVFIGFLIFSMDLDIMNCFTAMVNNLLTYKRYLIQTDEKEGEMEDEDEENDEKKSPKETQKNNKTKSNNKLDQLPDAEALKDNEQENSSPKGQAANNSANSHPKKKSKLWKKLFQIGTDLPDEGEGQVEEGGESSYLLDNEGTPAIDFTDISSVMAWNNMRKLGFHHKQNDIEMIDRVSFIFWVEVLIILLLFVMSYSSLITLGEEFKATWVVTMLVMDIFIVVFSQLSRVHIQVQINKSFLSSVRAVMKVKQLLQQSKIIDLKRHIIIGRHKKRKGEVQSVTQTDSIYDFYARIKRKLDIREKSDIHYYDKLSKLVQFVQEDIKYDMENDQLKFLGLITATPAFEATLLTSVLGCIYWLFRAYMKYLNVDIGLLGE